MLLRFTSISLLPQVPEEKLYVSPNVQHLQFYWIKVDQLHAKIKLHTILKLSINLKSAYEIYTNFHDSILDSWPLTYPMM
jgi:hypothetical protein